MTNRPIPKKQRGAALVVSLVLLVALTVLAVSTMSTSSLEVAMAGNTQYSEAAFQLAETGVELSVRSMIATPTLINDTANFVVPNTAVNDESGNAIGTFNATTAFDVVGSMCLGYDMNTFSAYHFNITAAGNASRGAQSNHVQSFFVCRPSSL